MSRRLLVFYWLPVLLWMGLIFAGSTNLLSSTHTSRFLGPLLRFFKPDISPQAIRRVQFAIRKFGHTVEFGVLAVLFWRAFRTHWPARAGSRALLYAALVCSFLYAVSDEYHQAFYPSREARAQDVFIDTAGAAAGLLIALALQRRRRRPHRE